MLIVTLSVDPEGGDESMSQDSRRGEGNRKRKGCRKCENTDLCFKVMADDVAIV